MLSIEIPSIYFSRNVTTLNAAPELIASSDCLIFVITIIIIWFGKYNSKCTSAISVFQQLLNKGLLANSD